MFDSLAPGFRVKVFEGRESFVLELESMYEGETAAAQVLTKHNGEVWVGGTVVEAGAGREVGDDYEATLDQISLVE